MQSTNGKRPEGLEALGLGETEDFYEFEVEWGLPPSGFPHGDGIRKTTVDCFNFAPQHRGVIARRLSTMWNTEGETDFGDESRFYFFDYAPPHGVFRPQDIIAIGILGERELRLETNVPKHTRTARAEVERALGALVQHRERRREDPMGMG